MAIQDEYVHQPYSWLDVDEFLAMVPLNTLEKHFKLVNSHCEPLWWQYFAAVAGPVKESIRVILDESRSRMEGLSSTRLPRINKAILNDSVRLNELIEQIEICLTDDCNVTSDKNEFNLFPSCHYLIDRLDLLGLLVLKKADHYYFVCRKYTEHTTKVLENLGMVYFHYAQLFLFANNKEVTFNNSLSDVMDEMLKKENKKVNSRSGGRKMKARGIKFKPYIKAIALKLLSPENKAYEELKRHHIPEAQLGKYDDADWIPWQTVNFAAVKTHADAIKELKEHPFKGDSKSAKAKDSVSFTFYSGVIATIAEEKPDLFRQKL